MHDERAGVFRKKKKKKNHQSGWDESHISSRLCLDGRLMSDPIRALIRIADAP
jgi:hypothetical protein